jgi:hypothetical protein
MSVTPNLRFPTHEVWITLLLLVCLLLLAWVRITNPKKIPSLVSGFLKGGVTEEKTITPDSIALFFIFICSITLLAIQAFRVNGIQTHLTHIEQFLIISIALLAYYLLKTLVLLICGTIFQVESNARDYINEIYASAHLIAIGLFPAVIFLTFVNNINEDVLEKGIFVLLALIFLYRTIKMFILMMNRGLRMMYLFLYLCTLEIIPLVLLFEYRKGLNF